MKATIGTKIGMSQLIADDGSVKPVTLIQAGPIHVAKIKTEETDGYAAAVMAYDEGKTSNENKAQAPQNKSLNFIPKVIREFRIRSEDENEALKVGASFNVSEFETGDKVSVTGTSKGKGYAGTIKKWNFSSSARTHGGNGVVRKGGSIGSMYPQKVFKGKKMSGQLGHEQVTVKNLEVAYIDTDKNLLAITGAVPGPSKAIVTIEGAIS